MTTDTKPAKRAYQTMVETQNVIWIKSFVQTRLTISTFWSSIYKTQSPKTPNLLLYGQVDLNQRGYGFKINPCDSYYLARLVFLALVHMQIWIEIQEPWSTQIYILHFTELQTSDNVRSFKP